MNTVAAVFEVALQYSPRCNIARKQADILAIEPALQYSPKATQILDLFILKLRSVGQRAAKLLAVKVGVLKKKSAASAIPPELSAIAFGLGSNPGPLQSFSKFDSRQFCSPLTYRSQIFSIERSIPLFNCVKSSRCWQHFKGGFCPVKVTSFS